MDKTIKWYPSMEAALNADRYELCRFHRFLRSPTTDAEQEINTVLANRLKEAGGFTPQISKSLGW